MIKKFCLKHCQLFEKSVFLAKIPLSQGNVAAHGHMPGDAGMMFEKKLGSKTEVLLYSQYALELVPGPILNDINPFLPLVLSESTRIPESVPSAPRGPSDRSRTCITMVWIDTKYTNTHRPTARRRARSLGLGTPLAGNFFDLSREDLTSSRLLLLLIADELPARRAAQDTMRIAY